MMIALAYLAVAVVGFFWLIRTARYMDEYVLFEALFAAAFWPIMLLVVAARWGR